MKTLRETLTEEKDRLKHVLNSYARGMRSKTAHGNERTHDTTDIDRGDYERRLKSIEQQIKAIDDAD